MAKPEKKAGDGVGLGSVGQDIARGLLKSAVSWAGGQIETGYPDFYRAVAWIYTHESAETMKKLTHGTILAGATLLENIADYSPIPNWIREGLEVVGGDMARTIDDYFGRRKDRGEIKFPDDYVGPKAEDIPRLLGEFATKFTQSFRSWLEIGEFGKLFKKLELTQLIKGMGLGKSDLIIGAVVGLEPDDRKKLFRMWKKWTPQQRHDFTRLDKFFPNSQALSRWLKMTPLERKVFLEMTDANRWRLMSPKEERQFRSWRRNVERHGRQILQGANQGLEAAIDYVTDSNVERRVQLDADWYSPQNIDRHPQRAYDLPPGHPNHRERPRPRPWLGWIMTGVFVVLVVVSITIGLFATGCQNEAPRVMINSPENGVMVSSPSVRLIGQATDDRRVARLTVQLSSQAPRSIVAGFGQTVEWTTVVKGLRPGWNNIRIEVSDHQGRRNTTQIRVRYAISKGVK